MITPTNDEIVKMARRELQSKVVIAAGDVDIWEKLEIIGRLDSSFGEINTVMSGRLPLVRGKPIAGVISSGYEEIRLVEPGFCVYIADLVLGQDWRITTNGAVDCTLRIRIVFTGEAGYVAREEFLSDESTQCSFIIRSLSEPITATFKGNTAHRYCVLSMNRDYLRNNLGLLDEDLPDILTSAWAKNETVMGHFPMSKHSLTQASRLFNIRLPRAWHDLTVRTLALDLLRMVFDDWQNAHSRLRTSIRLTQAERSKLSRVREQIAADPAAYLTLGRLCARAKMNRNKLHLGFKQQYGVSIHEYQTELRMQAAMDLLQTTDAPIAQIADRVGYGEPTNFTAAFKKHFGALPRDVRAPTTRSAPVSQRRRVERTA